MIDSPFGNGPVRQPVAQPGPGPPGEASSDASPGGLLGQEVKAVRLRLFHLRLHLPSMERGRKPPGAAAVAAAVDCAARQIWRPARTCGAVVPGSLPSASATALPRAAAQHDAGELLLLPCRSWLETYSS